MQNYPVISGVEYKPPLTDRPYILPLVGLLAGILIWLIDASVDVFLLGEEQTLLDNIVNPEITELWMRILVTAILIAMGVFARFSLEKHIRLDTILLNHKQKLEELVALRTKELEAKTQELGIIANQDPLTGLSNRRKFNEILQREYNRFSRHDTKFCIIMIDIDYFKNVNDTCGHDTGDEVIVNFSNSIRENTRKTDEVARWGGEEFIILAVETDENNVMRLANKVRTKIKSYQHEKAGYITASIGVSCCHKDDTPESLIKRADDALYQAKNNGRDRIEYV